MQDKGICLKLSKFRLHQQVELAENLYFMG